MQCNTLRPNTFKKYKTGLGETSFDNEMGRMVRLFFWLGSFSRLLKGRVVKPSLISSLKMLSKNVTELKWEGPLARLNLSSV